jgi:hypothetical protein
MIPVADMDGEGSVRPAITDADRSAASDFVLLVMLDNRPQPPDQFAAAWHLGIKVTIVWEVAIGVLALVLADDRDTFVCQGGEGHGDHLPMCAGFSISVGDTLTAFIAIY